MGREVLGFLLLYAKTHPLCFYDENKETPELLYKKFPVLHSVEEVKKHFIKSDNKFIVAVGHPRTREKLTIKMETMGGELASFICPGSAIFPFNDTYKGVFVHPGVGISHGVKMGRSCILHTNATIGHDVKMGNYVNVGPNSSLIGPLIIGDYCYIGANASVLPNVQLGKNVIISAGAVADADVGDNETVYK